MARSNGSRSSIGGVPATAYERLSREMDTAERVSPSARETSPGRYRRAVTERVARVRADLWKLGPVHRRRVERRVAAIEARDAR